MSVPDAAVEAMCDLSYLGKQISAPHARCLLEAALPHLSPLEALKPVVVDRAADCMETGPHAPHQVADLEEGVWRDCDAGIREQVAEAMHDHQMETHAWRRGCAVDVCIPIFLDRADAVLAALYPKATEGKS